MRLLWSLPKAIPAILRHLIAYAELIGEDLEQAKRDIAARLIAAAILLVCVFFTVLCAFSIVVALYWDTSNRVAAIACMGGVFLALSIACGLYRAKLLGGQAAFLSTVRREWSEDRAILEKILSDQD